MEASAVAEISDRARAILALEEDRRAVEEKLARIENERRLELSKIKAINDAILRFWNGE